jgi:hypothetical protein
VDTSSQSIHNVHRSPGKQRQIVVDRMKENLDPKDINSDHFEKISRKVSELTGCNYAQALFKNPGEIALQEPTRETNRRTRDAVPIQVQKTPIITLVFSKNDQHDRGK